MSFGWMGRFREGSWRAFRTFILNERRDLGRRLAVLTAEVERIGFITVLYAREDSESGGRVTERRTGFTVTPGSTLEKLVQAYVAAGGNPFDISHFFHVNRGVSQGVNDSGDVEVSERYPYGGLAYPTSVEPNEPGDTFGLYTGGYLKVRKYPPLRQGGRTDNSPEQEPILNHVLYARRPFEQEISYKRNSIEARIIKQCDLREQLEKERDEVLAQAFGGLSDVLPNFDPSEFEESLRVPRIVDLIDGIFYSTDQDGYVNMSTINPDGIGDQRLFPNLWPNDDEEGNTAI